MYLAASLLLISAVYGQEKHHLTPADFIAPSGFRLPAKVTISTKSSDLVIYDDEGNDVAAITFDGDLISVYAGEHLIISTSVFSPHGWPYDAHTPISVNIWNATNRNVGSISERGSLDESTGIWNVFISAQSNHGGKLTSRPLLLASDTARPTAFPLNIPLRIEDKLVAELLMYEDLSESKLTVFHAKTGRSFDDLILIWVGYLYRVMTNRGDS